MAGRAQWSALELVVADISEGIAGSVQCAKHFVSSTLVLHSLDWTTMLVIFWIVFGLFVYTVGNILFIVIRKRKQIAGEPVVAHSEKRHTVQSRLDHSVSAADEPPVRVASDESLVSSAVQSARQDLNVERKLFVKVVKANSLGGTKGCRDPYCVIEVDEPPQRMLTSTIKESSSPLWNEHFLFNLQNESSEILFEIYDKFKSGSDNFMGLGIVSVGELKNNPSQKQVITLQPRPLENDDITGQLTVEFLFMEHSSTQSAAESARLEVSPKPSVNANRPNQANRGHIASGTLTTSTPLKKSSQNGELMLIFSSETQDNDSTVADMVITDQNSKCWPLLRAKTVCSSQRCQTSTASGHSTNPFVGRSLSSDNVRLSLPTIPPVIAMPPTVSSGDSFDRYLLNSSNKRNPFNSLELSEELKKYYSIASNQVSPAVHLPPTPLFHYEQPSPLYQSSGDTANASIDAVLSSSSLSQMSVEGIETDDECDTVDSLSDEPKAKFKAYRNKSFRSNSMPVKLESDCAAAAKSGRCGRCPADNAAGDGMCLHVSPDANYFDFDITTESPIRPEDTKGHLLSANKNNLNIHTGAETNGSEGYGTGRGTPDNPSLNEGSVASSASSRKSRSKEPRSIIKSIRKRFSFNKHRSKSVEIRIDADKDEPSSRDSSVSASPERVARSVPGSREPSAQKEIGQQNAILFTPNGDHTKDSNSNLSEISSYSTRTFVHEKSTLIVEANDNGVLKHFVIPISLADKSKWRRRGRKLHVYNDHIFVAKHISGSVTCQVCSKLFSRRPGKQAYQCRDCNYLSHKRCHISVDQRCPKSSVSSLNYEHVSDPKITIATNGQQNRSLMRPILETPI